MAEDELGRTLNALDILEPPQRFTTNKTIEGADTDSDS